MYPVTHAARDRFVLDRRGPRTAHNPWQYHEVIVEDERAVDGSLMSVATVLLTGRECPWRCVMCDLWQYATAADTPSGAIPTQIAAARRWLEERHAQISQLKLYNAANFFDPHAVPDSDYDAIASELRGLDRVIVESHPALIGKRVQRFLDALAGSRHGSDTPVQLEVAMGLETAHPEALERLNKQITVEGFATAANALRASGVDVRVFLLISPPFIPTEEQDRWLSRSIEVAFSCGATVVSLVPTRTGNGAMEALAAAGQFYLPRLEDIERSLELALAQRPAGRVFVDLWDLERFARCVQCLDERRRRLHRMNLEQTFHPAVACRHCGHGVAA